MTQFQDIAGRAIEVGDVILYAMKNHRSPGLSYGLVLGIKTS